jgi:asparagine synthase (glutamine-hydrolysing)
MCGIYGEFFSSSTLSKKEDFTRANDLNQHRGPDASGYWSNDTTCQFGFRRLSILDLSDAGNQPMFSNDGRWVLVFNGEIYNYDAIKLELNSLGCVFKSGNDAEVLVNSFQYFGIAKTLDKIDGMFAISLFDTQNDSLYLIRDFAGIKPLFYSLVHGDIVFGSQYNQIVCHPLNVDQKVDVQVLKLYLEMHYIPAPYGLLEHTHQVEPGQIIEITKDRQLSKKQYWEFPELDEENLISDKKEALKLIEIELKKSVAKELNSDVPVGTFLSGGIDSPLISYFANKQQEGIKAFSIGSDSHIHDESEDASYYAAAIGCDFYLDRMNAIDALQDLDNSMDHLFEPFADFSLIPTYVVSKNVKKQCTVILSGDGGDELFFGYERFYALLKNLKFRNWPFKYILYGLDKLLCNNRFTNGTLLENSMGEAHQKMHSRTSSEMLVHVFPKLSKVPSKRMKCYDYDDESNELHMLHKIRKAEFYGMMQKTLAKVDRMSMAHSVEVRVPFLKKSFITAALKIDPRLSYSKHKKKEILKDLLRCKIPNAPINNVKRGFSIPLSKWLREELKTPVYTVIFNADFLARFQISRENLVKVWEEHQNNQKDHKWFIFTLYSLAKWNQSILK